MREFIVLCRKRNGRWSAIEFAGEDVTEALASARETGIDARFAYARELPNSEIRRLHARASEYGDVSDKCIGCEYSLAGLDRQGPACVVVCPECGLASAMIRERPIRQPVSTAGKYAQRAGWCAAVICVIELMPDTFGLAWMTAPLTVLLGTAAMELSQGQRGRVLIITGVVLLGLAALRPYW